MFGDELMVQATLADLHRATAWWAETTVQSPAAAWCAYQARPPVVEPPRADARRILGTWLAARQARMRAARAERLRRAG
jgi:hypothetical protein